MDFTQKQQKREQMERFARNRDSSGFGENFSDDEDEEDSQRQQQTKMPVIQSQVVNMHLRARNEYYGSNQKQNDAINKSGHAAMMAQPDNRTVTSNEREDGKAEQEFADFVNESASEWYEYRKCSIKEARDQRSCQRKSLYDAMQKQKTASQVFSADSQSLEASPKAIPNRNQLQLYNSAMKTITQRTNSQVMAVQNSPQKISRNYNAHAAANTVQPKGAHPSFSLSLQKNDRDPQYQSYNQLVESQLTVMQQSRNMVPTSPRQWGQQENFIVNKNNTGQQQQYQTSQNLQLKGNIKTVNNTTKFKSAVDLNHWSNQQSNQIEDQQYKHVESNLRSFQVPLPKRHTHGRNYDLMKRPKKQDTDQSGVEMEAIDSAKPKRFEEIQCFRHSMVTNMQTRNFSMKFKDECSNQSTVMDSRTFKISNSYGMMKSTQIKLNQNNFQSRRTFNTENKYSLGGKSAHSIKIRMNEQDEDDDVNSELESKQSNEDNKVLVYETKQSSQNYSPLRIVKEETPKSQIDYFANKKNWNNLKFYDEWDFDPVHYLSQRLILAKKYNYTVPESFGSSSVVLKYSNDTDSLEIYKVDHLVNKSDNDDSKYIIKGGKKHYQLDQLVKSIKISEINGFIYGPFSTRFWMMRMGINQLIVNNSWKTVTGKDKQNAGQMADKKKKMSQQQQQAQTNSQQTKMPNGSLKSKQLTEEQMKKYNEWQNCLPFYAWNCITLQMDDRDIDLIFFDDQSVKIFILFLIMKLDTYNGIRNSLESLRRQNIIKKRVPTKVMMQKIFFNFFIMKIRMKMSFEACVQHRTLKELWLLAILKSYEQRNKLGLIEKPFPKITRRMLHRIRNLCFKGLTENSLEEENKLAAYKKEDLMRKKQQGQKQEKTLTNFLKKSILSKDDIDDLFEEHYQSEDSNTDIWDEKLYVRQTDPNQKEDDETKETLRKAMSNKQSCEQLMNSEKMQHKTQQFKRRYLRSEKRSLYSKIMLLVNLRVLKGPLYIYALLECVKLNKSILILELELGKEAAIPKEFNIKLYPCCFQYYDCLNEVISKNFSQQQKTRLLSQFQKKQENQSKIFSSKKHVDVAKQKDVSIGERIIKDFKNFFSSDDMQDPKSIRNKEFKSYLSLFDKAENIQSARYIDLNKHQLRRTVQMSQQNQIQDEITQMQASQKNNLETQTGLHLLKFSTYENFGDFQNKEMVKDNDLNVDLNYMTQIQVGRKRRDLFVKKVLYQNQLTALKQKGKRLLMCERLDAQSIEQTEEFLDFIEKQKEQNVNKQPNQEAQENQQNNSENQQLISELDMKNFIRYLNSYQESFQKDSVLEQEDTVMRHRAKLIKGILSRRNFQDINNYLDAKIKYDQRFFQKGYAEYQAFMSDIRKQIQLNEQILRLRDQLGKLQKTLDLKNKKMYDSLDANKKIQEIQKQKDMLKHFRNQVEDEYEAINENKQKSQKNLTEKLQLRNHKTLQQYASNDTALNKLDEDSASKNCMSSFLSQQELNIKNNKYQLSNDLNQNMPITDAFESKNHTPILSKNAMRLKKKVTQIRRPMSENGQIEEYGNDDAEEDAEEDAEASSESSCQHGGLNEVLSKVDSSYPSMREDDDDGDADSIKLVHLSAIEHGRQNYEKKEGNMIINQMRQVLKISNKQKTDKSKNLSLFKQLALAVGEYDAKCPINQEMKKVRSKIVRKRARIHLVQTEGQKTLWGKEASYEPGDVYKYHKRQSKVSEHSNGEQA